MADEIKNNKPETPKVETPKAAPKEAGAKFSGQKPKPGSPNAPETTPVGINKGRFESKKHADKRVNKMFKDTNQPTLGVWNHDKKDKLMAAPDQVKFNPKFDRSDMAQKAMKDREERKKASELFNMDLTKPEDSDLEPVEPPTEEEIAQWKAEDEEYGRQMKEKYGLDELPEGYENMSEEEIAKWAAEPTERERASELWGMDLNKSEEEDVLTDEDREILAGMAHEGEGVHTFTDEWWRSKTPEERADLRRRIENVKRARAKKAAEEEASQEAVDELMALDDEEW